MSDFAKINWVKPSTSKLSLDCRREVRTIDIAINGCFRRKDSIKVWYILYKRRVNDLDVGGTMVEHTTGLETLGLKGGWIFFCKSFLKSICFSKKGCFLISSAPLTPRRRVGSRSRRLVKMLLASEPISGPKTKGSVRIFWYILSVISASTSAIQIQSRVGWRLRTIIKGGKPWKHLIKQDSEGPPINHLVCKKGCHDRERNICWGVSTISLTVKDLGCKILGCATKGIGCVRVLHVELAETKVTEGNMTSIVQKNILRL